MWELVASPFQPVRMSLPWRSDVVVFKHRRVAARTLDT